MGRELRVGEHASVRMDDTRRESVHLRQMVCDSLSCRPMEGTGTQVNDQMKGSQKVAGFDYSDFESSMTNFDSSFQVRPLSCRSPCLRFGPVS